MTRSDNNTQTAQTPEQHHVAFVPERAFNSRGQYNHRTVTSYHVHLDGSEVGFLYSERDEDGTVWTWEPHTGPTVNWCTRPSAGVTEGPRPWATVGNLRTAKAHIRAALEGR